MRIRPVVAAFGVAEQKYNQDEVRDTARKAEMTEVESQELVTSAQVVVLVRE